jgi:PAS domain S-box-containing protein
MNIEEKNKLLPKKAILLLLLVSSLPLAINFMSFSNEETTSEATHIIIHNIFDITLLFLGVSALIFSIMYFIIRRDFKIPIVGNILFFNSIFHLVHTAVFYTISLEGEESEISEVFYWTLSSAYGGIALLLGMSSYLIFDYRRKNVQKSAISLFAIFSILVFLVSFYWVDLYSAPNLISENELIERPWEIVLCLVYLGILAIGIQLYKKKKNSFTQSLILLVIPNLFIHASLGFQFGGEFQLFLSTHVLRLVSYLIPLVGIIWSFFSSYYRWNTYYGELEVVQEAMNASALVSETDINGNIIFVNKQFCDVSKYSDIELIGQNHRVVNSGYHPKSFFEDMWKTIFEGKIWKGEICNKSKDGSIYWVSSTIYPSRNTKGEIVKFVAIRFDITIKKRLEEKNKFEKKTLEYEARFLKLINSTSTLDPNELSLKPYYKNIINKFCDYFNWDLGHLYFVNNSNGALVFSSRIWGGENESMYEEYIEYSSKKTYEIGAGIPGKALKENRAIWNNHFDDEDESGTFRSVLAFPVTLSEEKLVVFEFFSESRNRIDREFMSVLKKIGSEITNLIIRKKLEIEVVKEKINAHKLADAKSEFLANMSHEIRTPMNGILGMVTLIEETNLSDEQDEMLHTIKSCGDSLLTVINDVLDFSKIDSGKFDLDFHDFNMSDCVNSVLSMVSPKALDKNIKLQFDIDKDIPDLLFGDQNRIKQILLNFISNSLKFTEKGSVSISVNIISTNNDSYQILLAVKDTGIGISEKNQNKLFKAFSQADTSTTRKFGGTGLGLAISSKLAALMKGKVWLESELGTGSIFYLQLPLSNAKEEKKKEVNIVDMKVKSISSSKVLVVEDNKINQKIAKMMLKKIGLRCDIAENGVECLNKLEKNSYDLIFMDMQMPLMDGITATTEIVRIYGESRPKIVAMTANVFQEDRKKCMDAGMDDFIAKPISIEEVERVFEKVAA